MNCEAASPINSPSTHLCSPCTYPGECQVRSLWISVLFCRHCQQECSYHREPSPQIRLRDGRHIKEGHNWSCTFGFAVMGLFDVPGQLKEPRHPNGPQQAQARIAPGALSPRPFLPDQFSKAISPRPFSLPRQSPYRSLPPRTILPGYSSHPTPSPALLMHSMAKAENRRAY